MSSPERSTEQPVGTTSTADTHSHDKKPMSRAAFIITVLLTVVVAGVAGFVITIAAGRVPEDRGRDHPDLVETSSIEGPAGDNSNG